MNYGNGFYSKRVRFPCGCLDMGHSLDLSLDMNKKTNKVLVIWLTLYVNGSSPLKFRLKQIWKLLRGEDGEVADFVVRGEDIPAIISLLSEVVKKK